MASKELVRKLFLGQKLPRFLFIPWLFGHLAKLEQISTRTMSTDPSKLFAALQNAWKLYGYDAIASPFDLTLEAEACGGTVAWQGDEQVPSIIVKPWEAIPFQIDTTEREKKGRLPVVLEAMRRLKIVLGQTVPLVVVITGPLSLAAQLLGRDIIQELQLRAEETNQLLKAVTQVITQTCRAYCELEIEAVAIADEYVLRLPPNQISNASTVFRTIGNLVRFYNAHPILVTKVEPNDNPRIITEFHMDGASLGGHPDPADIKVLIDKGLIIGIGIPSLVIDSSGDELPNFVSRYVEVADKRGLFFSSEWELPSQTPPETIHNLVKLIASF